MAFELNKEDYEVIQERLQAFLDLSEAKSALLCDRGGAVLFQAGSFDESHIDLICALVAGSYAATSELAAILGEERFRSIYHEGEKNSIYMSSIGQEVLLLAIFDEGTNAGLVKVYSENACRNMIPVFEEIVKRAPKDASDPTASFIMKDKFF